MKVKHTQGEWSYSPMIGIQNHCKLAQVWDSEGNNLASIDSRYGAEEATANARLIAVAPELLNSCIELFEYYKDEVTLPNLVVLENAKNAIKKATE